MTKTAMVFEGDDLRQWHAMVLARLHELQAYSNHLTLLNEASDREPFLNYMLFTHWPDLASHQPLSAADIYYNRLRWFTLLAAHHPDDAGIQQQHFQLLADSTPADVDWEIVQQILTSNGLA